MGKEMTSKIKWIGKRIEVEDEDQDPNYYDLHFPRESHYISSHYEIEFYPICGSCEANMQIDYKFCPYCGVELEWTDKPQKIVEVIDHSPWKEEDKKMEKEFKLLMEELNGIGENDD